MSSTRPRRGGGGINEPTRQPTMQPTSEPTGPPAVIDVDGERQKGGPTDPSIGGGVRGSKRGAQDGHLSAPGGNGGVGNKKAKKGKNAEPIPLPGMAVVPYGLVLARTLCSTEAHKKKDNCTGNPWCVWGMDKKEGIWASPPLPIKVLGEDVTLLKRKSHQGQQIPLGLKNLGATCYLNVLIQVTP